MTLVPTHSPLEFRKQLLSELIASYRQGSSLLTWDDVVFLRDCRSRLQQHDAWAWAEFKGRLHSNRDFLASVRALLQGPLHLRFCGLSLPSHRTIAASTSAGSLQPGRC